MSDPSGLLREYMADDPNLRTQPTTTENHTNGPRPEEAQLGQNNTQNAATGTNATPGTTNTVGQGQDPDVEMTNSPEGRPGQALTNIGTVFGGLTSWFSSRSDTETRKRKDRSPSPVTAADGEDQSADTGGANKKLRATIAPEGAEAQEVETGAVNGQTSTTPPSGGGVPEQNPSLRSMPGALSLTGVGATSSTTGAAQSLGTSTSGGLLTQSEPSTSATTPSTTDDNTVVTTGPNPAITNHTGVPGSSHTNPVSGAVVPPPATTTPPGSPPRVPADLRSIPPKDKTPPPGIVPPNNRVIKRLPDTVKAKSGLFGQGRDASGYGSSPPPVAPVAPTAQGSASSSTTPNNPDPWALLAHQFDGVRTEIQSMGTHMRTMNNNIGRLDSAVGIMTEQHVELMSVLRTGFAAAGQPPAPRQTSSGQPPTAPTGDLSLVVTAPPATGPAVAGKPSASSQSRTTHAPRGQIPPTTSSRVSPASSSSRNRPSHAQTSSDDDDMEVDGGDVADTEGEIPEPLPVVVKTSKLRLKGMPKTRDPARKALLDDIALMARKYMGRDPDPDDEEDCDVLFFDETKVPSRDKVEKFTGRDGQCCTIDDFQPDLLGTPRSTWNQSVAQVFAKAYVKAATAKSKNVSEVERAFGVHMKTLINSFKTFQASRTDNDANRRKRRRYMRKSYAHERRMMTVASHDGLRHHLWIIQALGVQGMSSDESEHEGTQVRYRRTTLAWRNPTLETFLQVIDIFHNASRFTNGVDKSSKSGAHVHLRLPAKKISERAAVPGLPLATYDSAWLKGLSDFFRNRLNISNIQYDFKHPPEVMKEMMQILRRPQSEQTQQTTPSLF